MTTHLNVAIDPGKTGAIAYTDGTSLTVVNMPRSELGVYELLRELRDSHDSICIYCEDVGYHVRGNNAQSSAKFARHVGMITMALQILSVDVVMVTPRVWMDAEFPLRPRGSSASETSHRKSFIQEKVIEAFPSTKITKRNADAVGILIYGIHNHEKNLL